MKVLRNLGVIRGQEYLLVKPAAWATAIAVASISVTA